VCLLKVLCADVTQHYVHQEQPQHPVYQQEMPAVSYKELSQPVVHWGGMEVVESGGSW